MVFTQHKYPLIIMQKSHFFLLAIIGILVIILMVTNCNGDQDKDLKNTNVYNTYTTDTTFNKKAYQSLVNRINDLNKKWEATPPKQIIYYTTPDPKTVVIEKVPDSVLIYIGELEERIAISDKYLKNWPMADKLIDFKLDKNNFDITTLNIMGETKTQEFPLYLNEYDYYWDENTFNHIRRDKPFIVESKGNRWNQLYIEGGYDFIHGSPILGLDYSLPIGRFKVSAQTFILMAWDSNQLYGTAKLGYRLFK